MSDKVGYVGKVITELLNMIQNLFAHVKVFFNGLSFKTGYEIAIEDAEKDGQPDPYLLPFEQ